MHVIATEEPGSNTDYASFSRKSMFASMYEGWRHKNPEWAK
jgi:hypothetical protein